MRCDRCIMTIGIYDIGAVGKNAASFYEHSIYVRMPARKLHWLEQYMNTWTIEIIYLIRGYAAYRM